MNDRARSRSDTYRWTHVDTAIGSTLVVVGPTGVRRIALRTDEGRTDRLLAALPGSLMRSDDDLFEVAQALRDLIDGRRRDFPFELDMSQGTPFQRQVWRELIRIPWGQTAAYCEIADRIGRSNAARAVGQANARNPLPVVVPCHRVISAGGRLGGYSGGLDIKRHLLRVEGVHIP